MNNLTRRLRKAIVMASKNNGFPIIFCFLLVIWSAFYGLYGITDRPIIIGGYVACFAIAAGMMIIAFYPETYQEGTHDQNMLFPHLKINKKPPTK